MENSQYFSREGLEKLKQELEHRSNVVRTEIALRIKEAKEQGDLSENAEYAEAKEAQSLNEGRIEELKNVIERAILISDTNGSGVVAVGSSLRVESKEGERNFVIVGAAESDPTKGYISNESPLGSAFLGHKKGDMVEVKTPKGLSSYKILDIK
ncbi:MAG: transcription elongation factor GreA [Candidatus Yanofskybacteria bacterium]|nr:transcription elongation factor GreA [Candidatus Yanofskybacteria bacterium]